MTTLIDTSVVVDVLRGVPAAVETYRSLRQEDALHASEITRTEVLAGARPAELALTQALLDRLVWHPVDRAVSERAAELSRTWRPSHSGIDIADFLIAATALGISASLCTRNVRHFPMFPGLARPY